MPTDLHLLEKVRHLLLDLILGALHYQVVVSGGDGYLYGRGRLRLGSPQA
jgi:hypothetical protein